MKAVDLSAMPPEILDEKKIADSPQRPPQKKVQMARAQIERILNDNPALEEVVGIDWDLVTIID